jgi:ubiquinone/menaquinone biosynthesis C-methylase UbiE
VANGHDAGVGDCARVLGMGSSTERYTHGHHESVLRSHRWRTAENSAGYLLPSLRPGQSLLDVGCGPGTITLDFARTVAPGPVLGIDPAEEPLVAAREQAASEGLTSVRFEVADVYALDLPDDSFDVVHAHQVLQHLADPVAALREMRRVCRPGGLVAARDADYAAMTWHPADDRLQRWLDLYATVTRGNAGEPDAGRRLRSWAMAAGFTDVTSTAGVWCFAEADERAWWSQLWADRITVSKLAEQALERGLATSDELAQIAVAWREWGAREDGWFAVLHGEILCRA